MNKIEMKICTKCKIEKDLSEFSKRKASNDKLSSICKKCKKKYDKKYKKDNYIIIQEKKRKYYQKNKMKILEYYKKYPQYDKKYHSIYYKENKNKIKRIKKTYRNSKAKYDTYASQISYADKVRNVDGFLQTKCTYCGKWYFPTIVAVRSRIRALNNSNGTEGRLYCSDKCKEACPIYNQKLFPKGFKKSSSREVQPELRQMVFERDNYTCLKCNKHQDELDIPLHCHHIEGILWNPLESADIDECMTACKNCHSEIHQQEDCRYSDMMCKKEKI